MKAFHRNAKNSSRDFQSESTLAPRRRRCSFDSLRSARPYALAEFDQSVLESGRLVPWQYCAYSVPAPETVFVPQCEK
jgi:hypothetical protein